MGAGDTAVFPRMRYSAKPGNPSKSSIRQIKLYSVAVNQSGSKVKDDSTLQWFERHPVLFNPANADHSDPVPSAEGDRGVPERR